MVPANVCFETLYCSSYVHNRLIGEMELVFLQRFTQGDFQNAAFLGMNMQLWFIRMMQPAAMFLRTVESKVSPANQHFRCSSRSEEHTSELQSLMRISYAVFCL